MGAAPVNAHHYVHEICKDQHIQLSEMQSYQLNGIKGGVDAASVKVIWWFRADEFDHLSGEARELFPGKRGTFKDFVFKTYTSEDVNYYDLHIKCTILDTYTHKYYKVVETTREHYKLRLLYGSKTLKMISRRTPISKRWIVCDPSGLPFARYDPFIDHRIEPGMDDGKGEEEQFTSVQFRHATKEYNEALHKHVNRHNRSI